MAEPDSPASMAKRGRAQNPAVGPILAKIFQESPDDLETRLSSIFRYARRLQVSRFLSHYELFKLCLPVKGSIVECGVFRGMSLMTWAHLSSVLEPNNINRRIYGFDTFSGFPAVSTADSPERTGAKPGQFAGHSLDELRALFEAYDMDRFMGEIPKVELIDGDVTQSIGPFLDEHPHLVISLLYLDMDIYEPTVTALRQFLPRMHRGSVLVFDELDRPDFPGETLAAMEVLGLNRIRLQRFAWDPHMAYTILD
jgi:hypothetical protein